MFLSYFECSQNRAKRRMRRTGVYAAALLIAWAILAANAYAMGGDHPAGEKIALDRAPEGLNGLINSGDRIGGFFVNAEDVLFYAGDTAAFNAFLKQYAGIKNIAGHLVVIHQGRRRALAPWDENKNLWKRLWTKRCDWSIETGLISWRELEGTDTVFRDNIPFPLPAPISNQENAEPLYYAEVHVWTQSSVDITAVEIPPSVAVMKAPAPGDVPPDAVTDHHAKPAETPESGRK